MADQFAARPLIIFRIKNGAVSFEAGSIISPTYPAIDGKKTDLDDMFPLNQIFLVWFYLTLEIGSPTMAIHEHTSILLARPLIPCAWCDR